MNCFIHTKYMNSKVHDDTDKPSPYPISKESNNKNINSLLIGNVVNAGYRQVKPLPPINSKKNYNWAASKRTEKRTVNRKYENQFAHFQDAMKVLLIYGQCLGLNPVSGISRKCISKIRFRIFSWRFLYSTCLCVVKALAMLACIDKLLRSTVTVSSLAFFCFSTTVSITSIVFLQIAKAWPGLLYKILESDLNEYIDSKVKSKCNIALIIMLIVAILEHILSFISRVAEILDCFPEKDDVYRIYIERTSWWYFDFGVTYHLSLGIFLQILNIMSTMIWNYLDLYVICISFYLTSILEKISKKTYLFRNKNLPWSFWCCLRQDYNRATQLVRSFDDVINQLVFLSFASNLFFICLQLFNSLTNGVQHGISVDKCSEFPSGPFAGYEHAVYFTFSLTFLLARSLAVSVIAAGVHSASLKPAQALYDVPSAFYCDEVQRFLQQVNDGNVALTGLQFFRITKGLTLTMAGTIATYELVLLQFNGETLIHTADNNI